MDSSTILDPSSAASLLQDLHLAGGDTPAKQMDVALANSATDVPSTPDRPATMSPTEETHHQTRSNLTLHCENPSSSKGFANECLFKKASLVSRHGDAVTYSDIKKVSFGISYPTRRRSDRRKIKHGLRGDNEARCFDLSKSMVPSSSVQIRGSHSRIANFTQPSGRHHGAEDGQWMNEVAIIASFPERHPASGDIESSHVYDGIKLASDTPAKIEKRTSTPHPRRAWEKPVRNELVPPIDVEGNSSFASEESHSSLSAISAVNKGKGIDLSSDSENQTEHAIWQGYQFDACWNNSAPRRRVRNEFKSPLNMSKSRNAVGCKRNGFDKVVTDEMNEKILLNGVIQTNSLDDAKSNFVLNRELRLACEESTMSRKGNTFVQPADDNVFRGRHRRSGKSDNHLCQDFQSNQEHEGMLHSICRTDSLEAHHFPFAPSSTACQFQNFEIRHGKGKRKVRCNHKPTDNSCSSSIVGVDQSHPEILGETSSSKSTIDPILQSLTVNTDTIIDVDSLPSPVSTLRSANECGGSFPAFDSDARAKQVESDEILARQLQEQFFNESSNFGGSDEIDVTIAWTLQQEEDDQNASSTRNRSQSYHRNPSIAHLYRQYPTQTSQDSGRQYTGRARNTSTARVRQLQRNLRRDLVLETRLDLLEGLDMASDSGTDIRSTILQLHRDFDENDYEMLLALDEDNHQHMGASFQQINSLPLSVIQVENVEEACPICLEKPSVGDTIRHLPCLHRFHKDCIDSWLRRRRSCPVCKSEIT